MRNEGRAFVKRRVCLGRIHEQDLERSSLPSIKTMILSSKTKSIFWTSLEPSLVVKMGLTRETEPKTLILPCLRSAEAWPLCSIDQDERLIAIGKDTKFVLTRLWGLMDERTEDRCCL